MFSYLRSLLQVFLLLALSLHACAEPQHRIAILGDSITYDGRWATSVESALRNLPDYRDAEIVNLGLSSETLSGLSEDGHGGGKFPRPQLSERIDRIIAQYKPTMTIACYGMNDGIFLPIDAARMKAFQDGATALQQKMSANGIHLTFVTAPLFRPDDTNNANKTYDAVLDAQASWLTSQSRDHQWNVIDIRPHLRTAISAEKQKNANFVYAADGVHPGDQGHSMIATAVAQGLWKIHQWPGSPKFADGAAMETLRNRSTLLKHAWLSQTGHKRPGVAAGKPLDVATLEATSLIAAYHAIQSTRAGKWNLWEKIDFTFDSRPALLVKPNKPAPHKPWIWRTEFFGHQPQADIALLEKGYHVAYIDMQNMYGSPKSIQVMEKFHEFLVKHHGLSLRTIVEGFSRGGLYAFNWAIAHPQKTAAIYVDAPVCDIKSWPGGKGKGPGSKQDWSRLLDIYQLTEDQAIAYKGNPIDLCEAIAKARIPIIAVIGQSDEVVPVEENIDIVEKKIRQAGGVIEVIRKPDCKHHPHSLPDPKPIVDFLTEKALR